MLQILIWACCVIMIEIGVVIKQLVVANTPVEKRKATTGWGVVLVALIFAAVIFFLSVEQSQAFRGLQSLG
jgi:hypothetical protein